MVTLLLLVVIVVALAFIWFSKEVNQRAINILLLIIAALVLLNSVGWHLSTK